MSGKTVAGRKYAHISLLPSLSQQERELVYTAAKLAGLTVGRDFQVVRIDVIAQEVALLEYPLFFEEAFPILRASWRVHVPTGTVSHRAYNDSLNPPILHRKELMVVESHPDREKMSATTRLAESIGLFEDASRIGFRKQWNELLFSKGYEIVDQQLVPIGNVTEQSSSSEQNGCDVDIVSILRHNTALSRSFLSAPIQALLRHGLLTKNRTFFDYGCGKGDDLRGVRSLGIQGAGWDPYFRPDDPIIMADVVNLGFVINVIEKIPERIEALQRAFAVTKGVLSVAAMLLSSAANRSRPYADGYLTSRNTFQRYYAQSELKLFIEATLDEQAFPIGPGIFFVFRDRHLEQKFLMARQTDSSRTERLLAAQPFASCTKSRRGAEQQQIEQEPARLRILETLWARVLTLGRTPEQDEFAEVDEALRLFRSWPRAVHAVLSYGSSAMLDRAACARKDEVRAVFAVQVFSQRQHFRDLEPGMRRDIKAFFGSLGAAEAEGVRMLRNCACVEQIDQACQRAATRGLGYLVAGHSLQLHSSLIPRLEPLLRVYIACASALYGDASHADVIKIHIQSGKLTLMKFEDFEERPVPRMIARVKVRLRDQDLDIFEYGETSPPPLLYFKSRYLNEEIPGYPEQLAFDLELEKLGIVDADGYGPDEASFYAGLKSRRREISGMHLKARTDIPALDEPCGRHYTYRQLVECGDTWKRTRCENYPRRPETYNALYELACSVLDPVTDYFGAIKLTYGFASPSLTKHIRNWIAPKLDQHASCELNRRGKLICDRQGAAVDFLVQDEDMHVVARWITENCAFDRLYTYGTDRPIHVSWAPVPAGEVYELISRGNRRIPRRIKLESGE